MRHQLLLAFLSATFTTAASGNLQRHRILPEHKEVTSPPALTSDPLTPNAINADGDVCSCSPTKFTFRLILSQDCSTDDIATNVGIDSTFCTVDEIVSDAAPINDEPIRRLQSTTPVEITSVQFLEFASDSFDVIYTDDSYIDTSLVGGDTVTFYSSSSYLPTVSKEDQEKYVPGGVSLILTGNTEDGSQIRNRFYWLYDEVVTDCLENLSTPGIYEGDAIGWISTVSTVLISSSIVFTLIAIQINLTHHKCSQIYYLQNCRRVYLDHGPSFAQLNRHLHLQYIPALYPRALLHLYLHPHFLTDCLLNPNQARFHHPSLIKTMFQNQARMSRPQNPIKLVSMLRRP